MIKDTTIERSKKNTEEHANKQPMTNDRNNTKINKTIPVIRIRGGDESIGDKNNTDASNHLEENRSPQIRRMAVTDNNIPFGHICDDVVIDNDTLYVHVYCQNVCGIFDREGIGLDTAFQEIKQAGADIFTFNETHGDKSKAVARKVLRLSKQRMWRDNNEDCKIVHSSSASPVLTFTKPGSYLVGITRALAVTKFISAKFKSNRNLTSILH
jgi:hypothetical protein